MWRKAAASRRSQSAYTMHPYFFFWVAVFFGFSDWADVFVFFPVFLATESVI